jgi:hypothetical protein
MELKTIPILVPEGLNVILGQSHFIKTAEDLYEILVGSSPRLRFGLAFSEASGPCLVRYDGNDEELARLATETSLSLGCGHSFVIFLRDGFPINVLNALKSCPEVCHIVAATANPLQVVVAQTEQGRGILGVIDGSAPRGVELEEDKRGRREFLRRIGYKR